MFVTFIMPPRKLQATPNITTAQRRTLRGYFSIPARGVGSRPSQAQLLVLRTRYNNIIDRAREFQAEQIIRERNYRRQQRLLIIPLDEWLGTIEELIPEDRRQLPFTLRIESAIVNGVVRDIRFDNFFQFQAWYNLIMDETIVSNSDTVIQFRNWVIDDRSIFDNSILTVIPIQGGCNLCQTGRPQVLEKTIVGEFNSFNVFNPPVKHNNCGIACIAELLGITLSALHIRREFSLEANTEIPCDIMKKIYTKYNQSRKFLAIISRTFSNKLNFELCDYILHEILPNGKGHFLVVKSINEMNGPTNRNQKYRRSLLAFDFETRNIDKATHAVKCGKSIKYNMVDTICSLEYRTLKRENSPVETKTKTFTTENLENTSARKFLQFLETEHRAGRHYTCIAHNGSRFDFLLLVSAMTDVEKFHSEFQYRGLSIISMSYFGHIFRDPCCFMPNSLENLCNNFKVEVHKLTDFELNGEKITNKNLCFYKPNLNLVDFLKLQTEEPDYWALYVMYCEYDCKSLLCLWEKFLEQTQSLIQKIGSYTKKDGSFVDGKWILSTCSVISKTTIGGLAKKIIDTLNKTNRNYNNYTDFFNGEGEEVDRDKYDYVCQFKRGGISHCNQAGKHNESVSSVDITSQYPTAMMKMIIPAGKSKFDNVYNANDYGYYRIKNLVFA